MAIADVHRIAEQTLAVGTDIEHHGNHTRGVDSASGGVDCQFSNRYFNPADAPIADAENMFGVGSQDQVDIAGFRTQIDKRRFDFVWMIDRQIDSSGPPAFVMVLHNRNPHREVVDDGNHLAQVLRKQLVEQNLIAIVQCGEVDVLAQRVRKALILHIGVFDLGLEGVDL